MTTKQSQKFDITKHQYTETEIIENMDNPYVSLRKIVRYQKNLSAEFCVKYIVFNDVYSSCEEDSYIDYDDVLRHQTHLTMEDLQRADID
jgi:hypothetical protein